MPQEQEVDTLYHYCSATTFESIIKNRSIRLSSLSLSNDSMEGKLLRQAFVRFIEEHQSSDEVKESIFAGLEVIEEVFDGLGFCLSEVPDLLSQWRGYANDAQGFSIGFSKKYLEEACKREGESELKKVLYKSEEHDSVLSSTFDYILKVVEQSKMTSTDFANVLRQGTVKARFKQSETMKRIAIKVSQSCSQLYVLKGHAFCEEYEWRILSPLSRDSISSDIDFRAAYNRLIPFKTIELEKKNQDIISEVYIGPKNITPPETLKSFLAISGFENVEVKLSEASYR